MQEGRTKKVAVNVGYNFLNQLITLVLNFLSRTIFLHVFGAQYLGLNGLFSDVLGLLSLTDLGLSTAMLYNLYRPLAVSDHKRVAALVSFYGKIYQRIAAAVFIIGLAIIPFLRFMVNLEENIPNLEWYYLFSLANVEFSYLCAHKMAVLTADQKNYVVAKINMYINIVKILLQIGSILMWENYTIYLLIGSVGAMANGIIISRKVGKEYPYIKVREELEQKEKTNIVKNISSIFLYKFSSVLLNATDNILISSIISTAAVGYYSNYLMVQTQLVTFYSLIFTSATASIGNLIIKEKADRRYEVFESEQSVCFLLCGILVPCYVGLINDFIRLWLGGEYVLSMGVVFAMGANLYLSCVLQPLWSYREATGLYQKTKWVMLICAFLNLVLSIILGKWIGVAGIILASALSRLLTYVWYEPVILFKEYFNKKSFGYYGKIILNLGITVILTGFGTLVSVYYPTGSMICLVCKAFAFFVVSALIMFCLYYHSNGIQHLIKKINKVKG